MGPCKGIYTLSDRRVEIEDFFLEKKELTNKNEELSSFPFLITC